MKITLCIMALIVTAGAATAQADSNAIPEWIKTTVGWWADGITTDAEFVGAITHLIEIDVIVVGDIQSEHTSYAIPEWVKTNVKWWADGITTDAEFVGAITHLIEIGVIVIESEWDAQLAECAEFTRAYQRLDCENAIKEEMMREQYISTATQYIVGPVAYYYPGAHLENTAGGQPLLTIRMYAINQGDDNITLSCTGPAICNYDVTDGASAFKYASTDFTSGSITLKPDQGREFEMIFGPNIGYGGTTFVYDDSRQYHFRINESFGSVSIPLNFD
ncbi:MAG: peptidase [Cenarchaeum sp. SB0672_bin_9]|nr:peptidase [Cenarchaeum sp. SB0672_bin_9]